MEFPNLVPGNSYLIINALIKKKKGIIPFFGNYSKKNYPKCLRYGFVLTIPDSVKQLRENGEKQSPFDIQLGLI